MTFEFVEAASGAVLDTVALHNTLSRDGTCQYCYARTGGHVRADSPMLGACSPPSNTTDLEWLQAQRGGWLGGLSVDNDGGVGVPLADRLLPEDMWAAGLEMDAQSDYADGAEEPGYVRSYRPPRTSAAA